MHAKLIEKNINISKQYNIQLIVLKNYLWPLKLNYHLQDPVFLINITWTK